ncbi:MAG: HAMP domain-containing histidine kinase [Rhodocyclales bacterium]|nr:HAMP domain-containing histidine kinase [Rhodocyclales bacterium]
MILRPFAPPATFAAASLVLIALTAIATGYVQSSFFRDAVIQREAVIVRDLATAIAARDLRATDLDHPGDLEARSHLQRRFAVLADLSGVVRIKVFNADQVVVWSDEAGLIGRRLAEDSHLTQAISGGVAAVFDPGERASHAGEALPPQPLIEFYVPFSVARPGSGGDRVYGAVSLYRSAEGLTATLRHGLLLHWAVKAIGGAILFVTLFWLFGAVYRRQREAERQFRELSSGHARIVQMEKLSAMGQMVGEIAHQFNNPLVGVINLAQRAEAHADDPVRVRELLAEIRRAGEHCSSYVQRMLRFTRLARSEPQPVALEALMRETAVFFRETVGATPEVLCRSNPEAGQAAVVTADPVLLRHALFNLIQNAAQADPRGPLAASLEAAAQDGHAGWEIAVADRGPGLAAEAVPHLFEPFFSTRPGGTGLGLSVARHIAVQHGGELRAEANPGGGARFVLWLPAMEAM